MDLLDHFFTAVDKAVFATSNGCEPVNELADLAPLKSELRRAFDHLILRPDPIAAAARSAEARAVSSDELFYISWRSGGDVEEVKGRDTLAKRLTIKRGTVDVYLSKGKGTFSLNRYHPETLERDQLTVAKALALEEDQPAKRQRGRPAKFAKERTITTQPRPASSKIPTEERSYEP